MENRQQNILPASKKCNFLAVAIAHLSFADLAGSRLDGFVARITEAGNPVWALPIGGPGNEQGRSVAVSNNEIIAVGTYSANFNLSSTDASSTLVPIVLAENIYIGRYDTDGVLQGAGLISMEVMPGFNVDVGFGGNQQYCVMGNYEGAGVFGIGQDGITVLKRECTKLRSTPAICLMGCMYTGLLHQPALSPGQCF